MLPYFNTIIKKYFRVDWMKKLNFGVMNDNAI